MADASLSESTVEGAALDWLGSLDWTVLYGPDIAPDTPGAERADYGAVVLHGRLRSALARLNPALPDEALDDALRRLTRPAGATLEARNRDFHLMLVVGVTVEYTDANGRVRGGQVRVLDFDEPNGNDWLAVNQFTVVENRHERRPDIVLFVNGLPLAVIELKNPADENATTHTAFKQLQTYKAEVPSLFSFNAALIVSDGLEARIGTLTAGWEWFKRWRTIAGEALAEPSLPQLRVLLEGVCAPRRLPALVRDFVVFEDDGSGALVKKMAGYHQFHAVQTAVTETLRAAALQQAVADDAHGRPESSRQPGGTRGDRRIGVVWHTQGSGKSLTMAFYAGRIVREPAMANPTVVVLTRSFAELLEQTIRRYQNRAVEAAQVIEELIGLAREMREADARGEALGLSDDELAFYDALGVNDSAVRLLGDETLRDIARELVETVRNNLTIDWTRRENVRANLRRLVKRVLRKYDYPPDKQESATRTVLEQAEVLSAGWAT